MTGHAPSYPALTMVEGLTLAAQTSWISRKARLSSGRMGRALTIFEATLGPEHPHTKHVAKNLDAMRKAKE